MGRVVHFEIEADDPARAMVFYKTVFGWDIQPWSKRPDYLLIKTGSQKSKLPGKESDGIDGAIVRRQGRVPSYDNPVSAFVCTVQVDDIKAACAAVVKQGGNMLVDIRDLPDIGQIAYCKDTEGNSFGLLQPASPTTITS